MMKVKHIIICGHSGCGALHGVLNPESVEHLPHVKQWLGYVNAAYQIVQEKIPNATFEEKFDMLIEENVLLQLRHLKTHPQVAAKYATNQVNLHAWTYNIGQGDVKAYDESKGCFIPVEERYANDVKRFIEEGDKHKAGKCCR